MPVPVTAHPLKSLITNLVISVFFSILTRLSQNGHEIIRAIIVNTCACAHMTHERATDSSPCLITFEPHASHPLRLVDTIHPFIQTPVSSAPLSSCSCLPQRPRRRLRQLPISDERLRLREQRRAVPRRGENGAARAAPRVAPLELHLGDLLLVLHVRL